MDNMPLTFSSKSKIETSRNFEKGIEACKRKNYKRAFILFCNEAANGVVEAENNLGVMYFEGLGIEKNLSEAVNRLEIAAKNGVQEAQNNLGNLFKHGQGVEQDYTNAIYWYRLAANQGYVKSQTNLAIMYYNGFGLEKDIKKAVEWIGKAAEQGYPVAQHNLGLSYFEGSGVEQNFSEAIHWFRLAANQGYVESQYNLGLEYDMGIHIEQDYVESARWYELAASQGHAQSQYNLGALYFNGNGVEQSYTEAIRWFELAADQGETEAQQNIEAANELRQEKIEQLGAIHVCLWADYFMAQYQFDQKRTSFKVASNLAEDFLDWLKISLKEEKAAFYSSDKKDYVIVELTMDEINSVTEFISFFNFNDRRERSLPLPDYYLDGEEILISTANTYCHILGQFLLELISNPTISEEKMSDWAMENFYKFYVAAHSQSIKASLKSR